MHVFGNLWYFPWVITRKPIVLEMFTATLWFAVQDNSIVKISLKLKNVMLCLGRSMTELPWSLNIIHWKVFTFSYLFLSGTDCEEVHTTAKGQSTPSRHTRAWMATKRVSLCEQMWRRDYRLHRGQWGRRKVMTLALLVMDEPLGPKCVIQDWWNNITNALQDRTYWREICNLVYECLC